MWHFDDLSTDEFLLDPVAALVKFVWPREELRRRHKGCGRHTIYSNASIAPLLK
jgi:hypothetical protein